MRIWQKILKGAVLEKGVVVVSFGSQGDQEDLAKEVRHIGEETQ